MEESGSKRQRRPNFSSSEIEALVMELHSYPELANGTFGDTIKSPAEQRLQWENIAISVNAVGVNSRTGKEIRDKWRDLKTKVKSKASTLKKNISKTGGGTVETTLNVIDEKVLDIMGRTVIDGIEEGLEIGACFPRTENIPVTSRSQNIPPASNEILQSAEPITSAESLTAQISSKSINSEASANDTTKNRRRRENTHKLRAQYITRLGDIAKKQEMTLTFLERIANALEKRTEMQKEFQEELLSLKRRHLQIEEEKLELQRHNEK